MLKSLAHVFLAGWGCLPLCLMPVLARSLGLAMAAGRFRRRDIDRHLGWAFPEMGAAERQRLRRQVYDHFAALVVECLCLPSLSAAELQKRCRIHNLHLVQERLAAREGFFALAAHVGNWELGLAALAEQGYPAHAVVKEIKGQFGQALVERMRGVHGIGMIMRGENAGRQILSVLKQGRVVGFVLDQNMTADEGVFVDFFGRPACTMPGLAVLASRSRVPVFPIRFERDPDGYHHDIWILPPVAWEEQPTREAAILHNTWRYTQAIEAMIRACPAQWLWMHRRWKTQPEPATASQRSGSQP